GGSFMSVRVNRLSPRAGAPFAWLLGIAFAATAAILATGCKAPNVAAQAKGTRTGSTNKISTTLNNYETTSNNSVETRTRYQDAVAAPKSPYVSEVETRACRGGT